jgi:hypothetical protein
MLMIPAVFKILIDVNSFQAGRIKWYELHLRSNLSNCFFVEFSMCVIVSIYYLP